MAKRFESCPLAENGGKCRFAWRFYATLRCFWGGEIGVERYSLGTGEVVERLLESCPRTKVLEAMERRREEAKRVGECLRMMAMDDERSLTEGDGETGFA